MKKNTIRLFSLFLLLGSFGACSDWLDVKSGSRVVQEEMFATVEGYHNALNGIYYLLSRDNLYAKHLSWGMVSIMGHNYNTANPMKAVDRTLAEGNYEYSTVKEWIDKIWRNGYNVIANCNNLIQHTENESPSFFPEGEVERDLILGEAYGIRAFMHFDLLRLFAPSPLALKEGQHIERIDQKIPYVTEYPVRQSPAISVDSVLNYIIRDLEYARTCLAYNDTLYNKTPMSSVSGRFEERFRADHGDLFFESRGARFNYFAATGLLARVYQYRGDTEKAYFYAQEVYKYGSWFPFTPKNNIAVTNKNMVYRKLFDDIILAFNNNTLYDLYENNEGSKQLMYKNLNELFAGDPDDYRATVMVDTNGSSLKWARPVTISENAEIIRFQGPLIPIIRKSEIYYIMCEHLAETDLPKAKELLLEVRNARGARTDLVSHLGKEEFLEKLYNEATREFLSEGQTFYLYKRLNRPLYNGTFPIEMKEKYILPIPDSETAY